MLNNKVGLLNFHYSDHNYGAVLQAAALADIVTQLGYNAEHINFIPAKIEQKKTRSKAGFICFAWIEFSA